VKQWIIDFLNLTFLAVEESLSAEDKALFLGLVFVVVSISDLRLIALGRLIASPSLQRWQTARCVHVRLCQIARACRGRRIPRA